MREPRPTTRDRAVVLLAQPRDDGLHMYAECLRKHGLEVIAVSEAWDALIAASKADIIVTEILLAGSMDGVGLIGRLRRNEQAERRPIIVLTACDWDAERERARRAGCDRFLAKPCRPSELLRYVRASLADVGFVRVRGQAAKARPAERAIRTAAHASVATPRRGLRARGRSTLP